MTELVNQIDETFNFNENNIRVIGTYKEPWFVAKDICDILGLSNITNALRNIPEKWMSLQNVKSSYNSQNMVIISEPAVYKLIMRSNKPIAQKFQEVVCEEILPSIRKNGEFKLQQMLDEKDNELKETQKEIKKLKRKYIKKPKHISDDKNVVYLMTSEEAEEKREYVIGKTKDLSDRKNTYEHNKLHDFKIIYNISCINSKLMDLIEACVLTKLGKYRCKAGRDVFLLPDEEDISLFTNIFDDCLRFYQDIDSEYIIFPKRTIEKEDSEHRKERNKKYYEEHKDEIIENTKEYYRDNKEVISEYKKEYYNKNIDKISKINKKYYETYKDKYIENVMEHYNNNREQILEERKEYYDENKNQILKERQEYYKENYETKIKVQRQKKETCECGMVLSHYGMSRHKKSQRHIKRMENKNDDFIIIEDSN